MTHDCIIKEKIIFTDSATSHKYMYCSYTDAAFH